MADRTSAEIFGELFKMFAKLYKGGDIDQELVRFWDMSQNYDFSPYQMGCNPALIQLGLAKYGIDPDYPEDGETILYRRGKEWRT